MDSKGALQPAVGVVLLRLSSLPPCATKANQTELSSSLVSSSTFSLLSSPSPKHLHILFISFPVYFPFFLLSPPPFNLSLLLPPLKSSSLFVPCHSSQPPPSPARRNPSGFAPHPHRFLDRELVFRLISS